MAIGLYAVSVGYWEVSRLPSEKYTQFYPEGWREIPLRPGPNYVLDEEGEWIEGEVIQRTGAEVNTERDRRIEAGGEFTLSDETVIGITGRQQDKDVLLARRMIARELDSAGETGAVLIFRDRDNVTRTFTPQQMIELVDLALVWFEAMMVRSWAMKDDGTYTANDGEEVIGIPSDLEADRHWPLPAS